ncbi:MAG: acyl-CoA thioesterase [Oscillospiraceae bacterium]|nr:acyl-CoA thioesterase [Oscillospiraceae bacterium]
MYEYTRAVFYYETDKMGVVHHSNYLRWMEEARIHYFNDTDLAYFETESYGVLSPITEVNIKFKYPARYGDTFTVKMEMTKYTGVRFSIKYVIINQNNEVLLEGDSSHAFIDEQFKPISLARAIPERHSKMLALL